MQKWKIFFIKSNPLPLSVFDIVVGFVACFLCVATFFIKAEEKSHTIVIDSGRLERERGKFGPSLSETLDDVNRQKNKVERQLAQQFRRASKRDITSGDAPKAPSDKKARFGDWELSLSDREEESLQDPDSSNRGEIHPLEENLESDKKVLSRETAPSAGLALEENLKPDKKTNSSFPSKKQVD